MKIYEKRRDLHACEQVFEENSYSLHVIIENGIKFTLVVYSALENLGENHNH